MLDWWVGMDIYIYIHNTNSTNIYIDIYQSCYQLIVEEKSSDHCSHVAWSFHLSGWRLLQLSRTNRPFLLFEQKLQNLLKIHYVGISDKYIYTIIHIFPQSADSDVSIYDIFLSWGYPFNWLAFHWHPGGQYTHNVCVAFKKLLTAANHPPKHPFWGAKQGVYPPWN